MRSWGIQMYLHWWIMPSNLYHLFVSFYILPILIIRWHHWDDIGYFTCSSVFIRYMDEYPISIWDPDCPIIIIRIFPLFYRYTYTTLCHRIECVRVHEIRAYIDICASGLLMGSPLNPMGWDGIRCVASSDKISVLSRPIRSPDVHTRMSTEYFPYTLRYHHDLENGNSWKSRNWRKSTHILNW